MHHNTKPEQATQSAETSSIEKVDYENAVSFHEDNSDEVFDTNATKRLLRKMDWALLPFLALLYLLSFLDRANIGNARLAGLEESLGMTGKWDYNVSSINTEYNMHHNLTVPPLLDRRVHLLSLLCRG